MREPETGESAAAINSRSDDTPLDPREMSGADLDARGYVRISRGDAIRAYCVSVCMCGSTKEVLLCANGACPMWPFRMGTDPWREKRELTEEQRLAGAERLRAAREARHG